MTRLTASETVYFHPDRFARERTLLDAIGLLHTPKKYDASELAEAILAAAFVDAERAGVLRLETGKASRLLGLRKVDAVLVHAGTAPSPAAGSHEAGLRAAVDGGPLEVERAVHAALAEDHAAPSMLVVGAVVEGLARRGLVEVREATRLKLFRTESYHLPPATLELAAKTDPQPVCEALDAWAKRPEWALLQKGIRRGITSRKEASDGPD